MCIRDSPGVVGIRGVKEKDINLKIAKELAKILEKNGYKAVLIRKDDNGLYDAESKNKKVQDMQKRCAMIKEEKPLLTVSIHQNSYQDEAVCGPQVFYYKAVSYTHLDVYKRQPFVLRKRLPSFFSFFSAVKFVKEI